MFGDPNTCEKCGHKCHCHRPDCDECINDVCIKCECEYSKKDVPDSFIKNPG